MTRPSDGRFKRHAVLEVVGGDAHKNQILRELGEGIGAVGGDDHRVLDAHAAHTGQVDAGLDGDHRAGLQGITGTRGDSRGLVDLEAHAVAGAVHERVAPAGGGDDVATRPVDGRAVGAGAHGFASGPLALAHDVPHAAGSGPGSPTLTVRVMSEQ